MIYIGNFLVMTSQEQSDESNRRHGEFNLIVDSADSQSALDLFRQRIQEYRDNSDFFAGDCYIFLVQLLEFDRVPDAHAVMLSYKSVVGDPQLPYIGCLVPTHQTESCRIYNWENNRPQIDGTPENLFLEFKAETETAS